MDNAKIKALNDARLTALDKLRAIYDGAETRSLTAEETASEEALSAEVRGLDERIKNGLEYIEARNRAEAAAASLPQDDRRARSEERSVADREDEAIRKVLLRQGGDALESPYSPKFGRVEERATQTVGTITLPSATGFGQTVAITFADSIYRKMRDVSTVMAANARVLRTANGEPMIFPRQTGFASATWVAEAAQLTESYPTVDTVSLGSHKLALIQYVSRELVEDNNVSLLAFLADDAGAAIGQALGSAFISGDGSGKPTGVLVDAATAVTAASATSVTTDELIDLQHSIPRVQRAGAVFVLNDGTVAEVRKLKDANGQYIWQPSLTAGAPDVLLGSPVLVDPAMPTTAAGNDAVLFGDLSGYLVRMVGGIRSERSDEFKFDTDVIAIRHIVRADGQLIDTTGIRVLTMAAV